MTDPFGGFADGFARANPAHTLSFGYLHLVAVVR